MVESIDFGVRWKKAVISSLPFTTLLCGLVLLTRVSVSSTGKMHIIMMTFIWHIEDKLG